MFDIELFIELVKNRPPLYDSAYKVYRCKKICKKLWIEIASIMDKDVSECKTVWMSLRSSYARHLQNIRRNAEGVYPKKKKHWYLADKLEFLYEHMQITPHDQRLYFKSQNINNASMPDVDDNSASFSNVEYKIQNNTTRDNNVMSEVLSEMSLPMYEETTKINIDDASLGENENLKEIIPQRNESEEEQPTEMAESSLTSRTKQDILKTREESTNLFFKSILFDLQKLSDRKLRLFKQDILKDLNKYLDENEVDD